jgi:hypothetical protein
MRIMSIKARDPTQISIEAWWVMDIDKTLRMVVKWSGNAVEIGSRGGQNVPAPHRFPNALNMRKLFLLDFRVYSPPFLMTHARRLIQLRKTLCYQNKVTPRQCNYFSHFMIQCKPMIISDSVQQVEKPKATSAYIWRTQWVGNREKWCPSNFDAPFDSLWNVELSPWTQKVNHGIWWQYSGLPFFSRSIGAKRR